jgi:hypothetical protein
LKKAFEIYIIKTVQSFDSTLSHVMRNSILFSNRSTERSKTNISRHICIITGVIRFELRKRNFHLKFLCIWVWIGKRSVWPYFCAISAHWEVFQVMLSTYHRAWAEGAVFSSFPYYKPHCRCCEEFVSSL